MTQVLLNIYQVRYDIHTLSSPSVNILVEHLIFEWYVGGLIM